MKPEEQSQKKYRLLVGIPTYGMPKCEFSIDSVGSLMYHIGRNHPEIVNVDLYRDVRTYRQEARNGVIEAAQKTGATHILTLDDDHVFDGSQFDLIWNAMQADPENREIISALYFCRGRPTAPCIFKLTAQGTVPIFFYPKNELMEVDVVGFGFLLCNMDLFNKKVNKPWFNLGFGYGEDAAFCVRLKQLGIKVWTHTGAQVGHLLEQPSIITEQEYFVDRRNHYVGLETSQLVPAGFVGPVGSGQAVAARPRWRPSSSRWWNLGRKSKGNGGEEGLVLEEVSLDGGEGTEAREAQAESDKS